MADRARDEEGQTTAPGAVAKPRDLPPAARRALAEAEARRSANARNARPAEPEIDGRGGLEPTRYGDWEVKGIISDF